MTGAEAWKFPNLMHAEFGNTQSMPPMPVKAGVNGMTDILQRPTSDDECDDVGWAPSCVLCGYKFNKGQQRKIVMKCPECRGGVFVVGRNRKYSPFYCRK